MKRFLPNFLRFSIFLMLGIPLLALQAQVTVNGVSPFSQYVTQLQGPGVQISNININCDTTQSPTPAMGSFDATMTALGVQTGTVMTTGAISGVNIPGAGFFNGSPGDPTMASLPQWSGFPLGGGPLGDACVITFDLIPSCDTIEFTYVFASNEYPFWVTQGYDDGFCAFIQGPGYPAFTNFALVPVVGVPVSTVNVSAANNTAYYMGNGGGTSYGGRTVVLKAKAAVTPCANYSIKLVIADEQDQGVDSGVFIEAITCGTDPPFVLARNYNNPNSSEAVEECVDGYFTFFNPGDISQPLTINFNVLGTATSGADYAPLPTSITIPAGQSSIDLPVNVVADGITEGIETVIIALNVLSCTSDTAIMQILDPFQVDAGPDQSVCSGETAILGGVPDPQITYNWQSNVGFNGPANSANPTAALITTIPQSFNYILTATDENLCTDKDTVKVSYIPRPQAGFFLPPGVCVNDVVTITFTKPPIPGAIYNWNFGPNTGAVQGSGIGPFIVSWTQPGPKTVSLFVTDQNCNSDTIYKTIIVHPIPTASFTATSPVCAGSPSLINYTGSASPTATFMWDTDGGNPPTLNGSGPHNVSWNTAGQKEITLTVTEFGCVSPQFSQFVTVFPVPTSDFIAADSVCENSQVAIVYSGTAANLASYAWNFDGGQVISGTGQGPYIIEWATPGVKQVCLQVEENGCISTLTCKNINVLGTPNASIAPVVNQCFNGNNFNFVYTGDPATSITWINGPDATPAIVNTLSNNNVTYLNPGVKTVYAIVTTSGCVGDTASITFEVVPEPSANFSATSNGSCVDSCITFTYTGVPQGPNQTYLWNFGSGAIPPSSTLSNPPCIDFITTGTQNVTLTVTYKGCTVSSTQPVAISAKPIASAGLDVEFCEGDGGAQISASVSGGTAPYFYSWWCDDPGNCGLSNNAIEDPVANPNNPAAPHAVTYYFIVNDVNGCASNIDSVEVFVKAKPRMDAGP
ncbi:MAG: choice-of-anchor L domain-containing protein, partial [Bacteroidetes bacterium]|nr:choice-of-anchor L domain-containing protein [Bacteroidota bacterium]